MKKFSFLAALAAGLLAPSAFAATDSDTVVINSLVEETVVLEITETNVDFEFTAAELTAGTYTETQNGAINGSIQANRNVDFTVAAQSAGTLAPSDIELKFNPSVAGDWTGNSFSTLTELDGTTQAISELTPSSVNFATQRGFNFDVKVKDANDYAGSTTAYTNTLTFTATTN